MPVFSTKYDINLIENYKTLFLSENCTLSNVDYAFFQAKNKLYQVTFYKSGKVLVQGKEIDGVVKKYFDENFSISKQENKELVIYPHIGTDESGKGDFFGPLVVSGCYLTKENAIKLKELGAMDSKKLDDKKILYLEKHIKENSIFDTVVIQNRRYNELYGTFKNLNKLLGWAHATVIENVLSKTDAKIAISDKFASDCVIENALKKRGKEIKLIQMTKAESDTAVACASILARAEFVKRIESLSKKYGMNFPKGAGDNVLKAGVEFYQKNGIDELKNVSKSHFKTYTNIVSSNLKLF